MNRCKKLPACPCRGGECCLNQSGTLPPLSQSGHAEECGRQSVSQSVSQGPGSHQTEPNTTLSVTEPLIYLQLVRDRLEQNIKDLLDLQLKNIFAKVLSRVCFCLVDCKS